MIAGMDLRSYLRSNKISEEKFADLIGVKQSAVNRYCKRLRIPRREVMDLIIAKTGGKVTANDFFDIAEQPKPRKARASA